MSSKAHAKYDPMMMGVALAVTRDHGHARQVLLWEPLAVQTLTDEGREADDKAWLRMPEEDARAIYEALADYFGHTGHDIRALRKDYEAERGRVDTFIAHLTRSA